MNNTQSTNFNNELISIITASYNYQDYIGETIDSVLAQTYPNWELIIVDDGSTDDSVNVIKSYCEKDSRVKLSQHDGGVNKGLAETVKLGLEKANANWLVFLESDDSITPDYLETKINVIKENPRVEFIFNAVNCFGDEEKISSMSEYFDIQNSTIKKQKNPSNYLKHFENFNIVPTFSCLMIKKELFVGLDFNSPLKPLLDWYLLAQIAQNQDFYYLDKKLTNWRMHKDSYINQKTDYQSNINFRLKILKIIYYKHNKLLYFIKSFKYYKKRIIRYHFKSGNLYLLGHWFYLKRRVNEL